MKLVCPVCQSKYDLEQAAVTSALKEMVGLAARFGRSWSLVEEYVETFRTSQFGGITIKKRLRLLQEVARLWEGGELVYNNKRYRTDRAQIREALIAVCNADKWGFQNHNYLKRVLMDGARRVSAEGMTAAQEQEREIMRRENAALRAQAKEEEENEKAEPQTLPVAEVKKRLGAIADQIGEGM